MNTLVRLNNRLDPSAAIFSHHLDDLFSGFRRSLPGETPTAVTPIKIEVAENATAYRVSAVLPGAKKEDIHIEVDQKEVSILAEITAVKNGVSLPANAHVAAAKEKLGPSIACATS